MIRAKIISGERREVERKVQWVGNSPLDAAGSGPSGIGTRPGAGLRHVSLAVDDAGGFHALVIYEDSA